MYSCSSGSCLLKPGIDTQAGAALQAEQDRDQREQHDQRRRLPKIRFSRAVTILDALGADIR
jgi:hypothetical protein